MSDKEEKSLQDELNELFLIAQSKGMTPAQYLKEEAAKLCQKN